MTKREIIATLLRVADELDDSSAKVSGAQREAYLKDADKLTTLCERLVEAQFPEEDEFLPGREDLLNRADEEEAYQNEMAQQELPGEEAMLDDPNDLGALNDTEISLPGEAPALGDEADPGEAPLQEDPELSDMAFQEFMKNLVGGAD